MILYILSDWQIVHFWILFIIMLKIHCILFHLTSLVMYCYVKESAMFLKSLSLLQDMKKQWVIMNNNSSPNSICVGCSLATSWWVIALFIWRMITSERIYTETALIYTPTKVKHHPIFLSIYFLHQYC